MVEQQKYCKYHPTTPTYFRSVLCRKCWDRERKWETRGININTDGYYLLLKQQNGTCLFCDRKPKSRFLDVDHHHTTGKVRGLLCNEHNRAVGVIEKNKVLIPKILKYLT